jgi:ribosomal protein L16 Arg81 hydroxylase
MDSAVLKLIAPVSEKDFLEKYWLKRALLIPGQVSKCDFLHFGLEDFVRAVHRGFDLEWHKHGQAFVKAGDDFVYNKEGFDECFDSGSASLCVINIHLLHKPFMEWIRKLQKELNFPGKVSVRAYCSAPGTGYSDIHLDKRAANTVQLLGKKHWEYEQEPCVQWPHGQAIFLGNDSFPTWTSDKTIGREPWEPIMKKNSLELTKTVLEPGDILCLPAGTWHGAQALEQTSLSLNIAFEPVSSLFIIFDRIYHELQKCNAWRGVPPTVSSTTFNTDKMPTEVTSFFEKRFRELQTVVNELKADEPMLNRLWKQHILPPD